MSAAVQRRSTYCRHHPRKRVIQYAAALMLDRRRHGVLGRPVKPGDDICVVDDAS